jgi:hypothetical protein
MSGAFYWKQIVAAMIPRQAQQVWERLGDRE